MSEAVIVALITGCLSFAGSAITCIATEKKKEKNTAVRQAVTDTKIDELTREVREHNGFAQKIPLVEQEIRSLNRRVSDLERYHRAPIQN